MVWDASSHGNFSLKSALAIIRKEAVNDRDSLWEVIWQRKIPQKINFFLWLAAHERLMTNANRFARGLAPSPAVCDSAEETTLYLLRDCSLARTIWYSLVPRHEQSTFFARPLRNWLSSNLAITGTSHGDWPTYFATALWWIWRWRNRCIFEEPNFTPSNPISFNHGRCKSIMAAMKTVGYQNLGPKTERYVCWKPPPLDWYKLNVDGAAKGNPGLAGGGGVLRGHRGEWIKGFAANFGYCSSVKAELKALLQGIRMAKTCGVKKLIIHMDSMVVAQKVNGSVSHNQPYLYLLKECQTLLLNSEWRVTLEHCYRETN